MIFTFISSGNDIATLIIGAVGVRYVYIAITKKELSIEVLTDTSLANIIEKVRDEVLEIKKETIHILKETIKLLSN